MAKRRTPAKRVLVTRQQPESLRLRSAAPAYTVNDIDKSLAFFRDVLRFTVKQRWDEDGKLLGVELAAGSVLFMLSQDDWKKGRGRAKGEGFRLYCTTAQDVDRIAAEFEARGVKLLQEPRSQPWGMRDFAVADPDGFKITISNELKRYR
jgi:uncharacterized glyoxalase superfamily protein PhnB